jgi:hypothetical protein
MEVEDGGRGWRVEGGGWRVEVDGGESVPRGKDQDIHK